eukprot:scaffold162899_cov30-Tisochrysis_lutea.AAC.2
MHTDGLVGNLATRAYQPTGDLHQLARLFRAAPVGRPTSLIKAAREAHRVDEDSVDGIRAVEDGSENRQCPEAWRAHVDSRERMNDHIAERMQARCTEDGGGDESGPDSRRDHPTSAAAARPLTHRARIERIGIFGTQVGYRETGEAQRGERAWHFVEAKIGKEGG